MSSCPDELQTLWPCPTQAFSTALTFACCCDWPRNVALIRCSRALLFKRAPRGDRRCLGVEIRRTLGVALAVILLPRVKSSSQSGVVRTRTILTAGQLLVLPVGLVIGHIPKVSTPGQILCFSGRWGRGGEITFDARSKHRELALIAQASARPRRVFLPLSNAGSRKEI